MSMVVQHNLQAMNSNRMLGITTSSQSKSTEKLSSGYKINRAADDAAGLTISEKMRKQMRGLDRASTNAEDGVSAVQTAEGALTEVHSMLQRMNELAVQSANGTNSDSDREAIQAEIDQLVTEIDRVSETTKFNEIYLLKGDASQTTTKTVGDYKYEMTQAALDAQEVTFTVTANAYAGGETDAVTAGAAAANATISFSDQGGGTNHLYVSPTGAWTDTVEVDANNFSTYFDVDDDGNIVELVSGATYGSAASAAAAAANALSVTAVQNAGWLATTPKTSAVEDGISQYIEVVDGVLKYKEGQILYSVAADADAANNEYGDQTAQKNNKIDETDLGNYFSFSSNPLVDGGGHEITDVSAYFKNGVYQGGIYRNDTAGTSTEIGADQIENWVKVTEPKEVNVAAALEFNLHVGADADTTNKIGVKIDAMSAKGIGVDGLKVDSEDSATAAIDTIAAAIQQVSSQRSALGAIQNRLEHTIANLDNIVENTTAAESRIRDTDMAEEMVEYSKNNILAQAGQSMLAQANQSTQGVLSLLG